MLCCWASMRTPALVWTHSRHIQLLNHRFIKNLWGHSKQPTARVLCSLLSKAKHPALLSYILFHFILFYLNKIFLFVLYTNLSFPAPLLQVPLISMYSHPFPLKLCLQKKVGLPWAWAKHSASGWVRTKLLSS